MTENNPIDPPGSRPEGQRPKDVDSEKTKPINVEEFEDFLKSLEDEAGDDDSDHVAVYHLPDDEPKK